MAATDTDKPMTIDFVVKRPKAESRWRWFVAYHLIKLAARFYPFQFQMYRTPEIQDYVHRPPH